MPEPTYTHGHADSVLRSHRWRTAENSAAYLLPRLRPGDHLLDVGCGPGTITADLARRVSPGRVLGIDQAESVIAEASAAASADNLEFQAVDLFDVDGTFDVVHAHQVLQHVPDPVAALRRMGELCRPGGTIAARDGDYAAFTWWPADPALDRWLELYRTVARENGGEPDAGRRLLAWAREAGFEQVEASASVWCFADPDSRAWWAGLWAERVTRTKLADDARARGHATDDDLAAMAEALHRWSAAPDAWFAVLHGEILVTK